MSFFTLVKQCLAPRSRPVPAARRQRRFVPQVEGLEDRQLLSTFSVVNTNDSGPGSFRQAILNSNATSGSNTIDFNIGTGAQTINLQSPLPAITMPVVLNGTTQGGYAGSPLIELNGAGAGSDADGLCIMASNSTVEGLAINRFSNAGIELDGAYDTVASNYLGTDLTGTVARPNTEGVIVNGAFATIGGTTAAARNLISGNVGDGVFVEYNLSGSCNCGVSVEGNFIGTTASGQAALGNGTGIFGGQPFQLFVTNNVISGNLDEGVDIYNGENDQVTGNTIGVAASGSGALGNGRGVAFINDEFSVVIGNLIGSNRGAGVALSGALQNTSVEDNTIQQNGADGIDLENYASNGVPGAPGGLIRGNTIAHNSGTAVFVFGSDNEISGNTIAYNGTNGIVVQYGSDNTISGNTFISVWTIAQNFTVAHTTLNAL
jgi:parallel beta-helix repeat protein